MNITKVIRSQHVIISNYQSKEKPTLIVSIVISQQPLPIKEKPKVILNIENHITKGNQSEVVKRNHEKKT
jgi:predicted transcriptional regulator